MVDVFATARTAAFPGGTLLDGVYVSLHQTDGTLLAAGVTGELGQTGSVFLGNRAAGTYELRVTPQVGVAVAGRMRAVVAADDTDPLTFDVLVEVTGVTPPSDTRLCRCTGRFIDTSGRPMRDVSLTFSEMETPQLLYDAGSGTAVGVLPKQVSVVTDQNGSATIDLIRESRYNVFVSPLSNTIVQVVVPDAAVASLPELLFPVVDRVEYAQNGSAIQPVAAPTLTLQVGQTASLDLTTVYRSGYRVTGLHRVSLFVDDDQIVILSLTSATVLTIQAIAPGSATVEVRRSESEEASIYPPPTPKGFLAVTVNP